MQCCWAALAAKLIFPSQVSLIARLGFVRRLVALIAAVGFVASGSAQDTAPAERNWRSDWETLPGFELERLGDGFDFPTAITFIPQPGSGPKDPRYFVTELRGRVKAVSNDGTVTTFAEGFAPYIPPVEWPSNIGSNGAVGTCLDPEHGYLYVTYTVEDPTTFLLRNAMIRFTSTPHTYSTEAKDPLVITAPFQRDFTAPAHQIGYCVVHEGFLYVGVGDGFQASKSRDLASSLGKVFRMTLDGKPAPGNPFAEDSDLSNPKNYTWALGFRNPFSIVIVDGRIYVHENGGGIDRLVELKRAWDYGWEGRDDVMTLNAISISQPPLAPVEMSFLPAAGSPLPAPFSDAFYISATAPNRIGVHVLPFDREQRRARGPIVYLVEFKGSEFQQVAAVAPGPDGIYFAGIGGSSDGKSHILKLTFNGDAAVPTTEPTDYHFGRVMRRAGCYRCHVFKGEGQPVGPSIDAEDLIPRLQERLNSEAYRLQLAELDKQDVAPFNQYKKERAEILALSGDERLLRWTTYQLMEPKFDNHLSAMPNLGLTREEAEKVATALLTRTPVPSSSPLDRIFPAKIRRRDLAAFFLAGGASGAFGVIVLPALWRRFRRNPRD